MKKAQGYNILLFAGLNENAFERHITPLTRANSIDKITVIRDDISSFKNNKIDYVTNKMKIPILRVISKTISGFKVLKRDKIHYVHSFYLIPHGLMALFLAKLFRKKVGISLIGTDLDIHIKKRWYGSCLVYLLKQFDIVTVTGTQSKKYLEQKGINPLILPHCVDTDKFKPNDKIKKKYDLLFVGRLSPEKRLDRIIDILTELKKKKRNVSLAIVGEGPEETRIRAMVKKGKLESNVFFLGYKKNVMPFYWESKMVILMSDREGSPLVLPEAMSCGVIPVALKVGDVGHIVNESNGIVFSRYDAKIISESILEVLSDRKRYEYLRRNSLIIRKVKDLKSGSLFWDKLMGIVK